MKIKKYAAIYSIFMGISMIGMWIMFYVTNQIPELEFKPIETSMHITAEIVTAVLLIIGGVSLFNKKWGYEIYLLSMGMLLYTLIMSPGYFMEKGEAGFIIMFGVFIIIAIYFIIMSLVKKDEFKSTNKGQSAM